MDSGEFNKIAGAVIGALLLFLLLGFFSEQLYHGDHGEGEVLAYGVELDDEGAGSAEEEETIDLAALAASADPSAGESVFRQCSACHKVEDGANGVGPHLYGVVGREIASVGGYSYSDALAGKDGTWDLEALNGFLLNPKSWAPGTKMGYAGLKNDEDRINLIAWLNEADGSPIELAPPPSEEPAAEEPAAEEAAADEAATDEAAADATAAEEPATEMAAGSDDAAPAEEQAAAEEAPAEETPAEGSADAGSSGGGEYADLLAAATAEDGEKLFRRCRACHKVEDGANGVGPHLYSVINREIASVEGYSYSDALANKEGAWDVENLMAFLEKPADWAPGTKMAFAGLKDPADRAALIVYLNEADGSPEPLQ